ncbi:MAG: 5-formyltetrahydrofolate cyclo-ligase [Ruminococcaceae bacterium]|nr:5-formyltetrahydrofolate cyclo-ligase [Oscillospiraceae bacterium]
MTRQEEKQQLRKTMRALAGTLSPRYLEKAGQAIMRYLTAMPEYCAAGCVFCFVGRGTEVDTRPILEHALAAGKRLCVPLCVDKGIMELREITSLDQLLPGSYGLLEPPADSPRLTPDEVDFAVIPCLTCNCAGQRLGKGGGYYDRFLSHYRGGSVMLCPELLLRDEIPVEPHDYPIPWVLTERGLYEDGIPARLG